MAFHSLRDLALNFAAMILEMFQFKELKHGCIL